MSSEPQIEQTRTRSAAWASASLSGSSSCSRRLSRASIARRADLGPRPGSLAIREMRRSISGSGGGCHPSGSKVSAISRSHARSGRLVSRRHAVAHQDQVAVRAKHQILPLVAVRGERAGTGQLQPPMRAVRAVDLLGPGLRRVSACAPRRPTSSAEAGDPPTGRRADRAGRSGRSRAGCRSSRTSR